MVQKAPQIARLLMTLMARGADEMRLAAGSAPVLRLDDQDRELDVKKLEEPDLEQYVTQIAPMEVRAACDSSGRSEFGLRYSADGRRCDLAVILKKGPTGYELVFRMLGPVERDLNCLGPISELSEDSN